MTKRRLFTLFAISIAALVLVVIAQKLSSHSEGIKNGSDAPLPVGQADQVVASIIPNNTELGGLEPEKTSSGPGRLRINLDAYPQVLDPQKAVLPKEIAFLNLIYQGLTRLDEDLAAAPAAAEAWVYNQDATELVFTLRPGLNYSDGSVLNALRFEAALRRLIDPATRSEFAWLVGAIRGAPEWHAADPAIPGYDRLAYLAALGVRAETQGGKACAGYDQADCLTLRLEFSTPAPYFHQVMGLWITYPTRLDLAGEGENSWWLPVERRVGNGPYILADLEPFVRARFTPNPEYSGENAKVTIEFTFIGDPQAALKAYLNNQLEILDLSIASRAGEILLPEDQVVAIPGACSSMIQFGMRPLAEGQPSPFLDPKVRQAFVLAFDFQSYEKEIAQGDAIFTGSFIPPAFMGADLDAAPVFDPQRARETLAESAYAGPQGLNDLGLKLTYLDTPANQARYEWLAMNYRQHLGVEFQPEPLPGDAHARPEAGLLSFETWCALIPDPHGWMDDYWAADSPFRPATGYASPELETLLGTARIATSPSERLALYAKAEQTLLADAPAIFGWVSTNQYLVKPWVKGLITSPYDMVWPGAMFPERITIEP